MKPKPTLILGDSPRFAIPISRGLHRCGIPVGVAALGVARSFHSRSIQSFVRVCDPQKEPENFREILSRHISSVGFDMLIPTSDSALIAIQTHYDLLTNLLRVACPPPDVLRVVLSKRLTFEAARKCGVPLAETYIPAVGEKLPRVPDLRFPLIAKPENKLGARHAFKWRYFQEREDLQKAFEIEPEFGQGLIFQEYCPGEGVGIEVLLHDSEPIVVLQHRRLKEYPSEGGVGILVVSEEPDPVLTNHALKILRQIRWEGVAMVEFRHDRATGRSTLIEINGRYWGSVGLAYQLGLNLGFYQWQIAHGQAPSPPAHKIGVRARWTPGYFLRLHDLIQGTGNRGLPRPSLVADTLGFLLDLRPSIRDMVWSVSDPLPAVLEIARTLWSLIAHDCRRLLERVIPSGILQFFRRASVLEQPRARVEFLRLGLLRQLRIRRDAQRRIPASAKRILLVCHGNIIRSPMAEALLKQRVGPAFQDDIGWIGSAGLAAKIDCKADERARRACHEFGVSLDEHRTVRLTRELVQNSDVIFVMDYLNEARLLGLYPGARRKVFVLGAYLDDGTGKLEILDPYSGSISDVRACYEVLERAVQNVVKQTFANRTVGEL